MLEAAQDESLADTEGAERIDQFVVERCLTASLHELDALGIHDLVGGLVGGLAVGLVRFHVEYVISLKGRSPTFVQLSPIVRNFFSIVRPSPNKGVRSIRIRISIKN